MTPKGKKSTVLNQAQLWYQKAQQYDIEAMYEYGHCAEEGKGIDKNVENAIYWYNKAIALEKKASSSQLPFVMHAMVALGKLYYGGEEGIEKNIDLSIKFFSRAAITYDCSEAFFLLGVVFSNQAKHQTDPKKRQQLLCLGLKNLRMAADKGYIPACMVLGNVYEKGVEEVLEKDVQQAKLFYKIALIKGHSEAFNNLLLLFKEENDQEQLFSFLELAAGIGFSEALHELQEAATQSHFFAKFYLAKYYTKVAESTLFSDKLTYFKKAFDLFGEILTPQPESTDKIIALQEEAMGYVDKLFKILEIDYKNLTHDPEQKQINKKKKKKKKKQDKTMPLASPEMSQTIPLIQEIKENEKETADISNDCKPSSPPLQSLEMIQKPPSSLSKLFLHKSAKRIIPWHEIKEPPLKEINIARQLPPEALNCLKKLEQHHYLGYGHGGWSLNILMNKAYDGDIDIVTTAPIAMLKKLFPEGKIHHYLTNLYRFFTKTQKPVDIYYSKELITSLEADAKTGDFTVNKIYYNVNGDVFDPLHRAYLHMQNKIAESILPLHQGFSGQNSIRLIKYVSLLARNFQGAHTPSQINPFLRELHSVPLSQIHCLMSKHLSRNYAIKFIDVFNQFGLFYSLFHYDLNQRLDLKVLIIQKALEQMVYQAQGIPVGKNYLIDYINDLPHCSNAYLYSPLAQIR